MNIAPVIAQGTATAALEASSEMWTLESKEPRRSMCVSNCFNPEAVYYLQMVHSGAWNPKMKAKPFGQPLTIGCGDIIDDI